MTDPAELARRLRNMGAPLALDAATLIETQAREIAEARGAIIELMAFAIMGLSNKIDPRHLPAIRRAQERRPMADEPRLSDAEAGWAKILDLASQLESYCEPPGIAGDAAAVMRAMVTAIARLRADLAAAQAAVRDAGSFWSSGAWIYRHRAAYDRALAAAGLGPPKAAPTAPPSPAPPPPRGLQRGP